MRFYLFILLFLFFLNSGAQTIRINEFGSGNILDENGESQDWIELYNYGSIEVNLQSWKISDDSLELDKWVFPLRILGPSQHLIIFVSDKDRKENSLHTNFKIGNGREGIYLSNSSNTLADYISPVCIPKNRSFGSIEDGSTLRKHFIIPSPGNINKISDTVSLALSPATIQVSHPAGVYQNPIDLEASSSSQDVRILFTNNGMEPDEESAVYSNPIRLETLKGKENTISDESTGNEWKEPVGEVYKTHVIRLTPYRDACPVGPTITNTYFIDGADLNKKYPVPIISLSTEEDNFFGKKKGIYVVGNNIADGGNFNLEGDKWERPIHFEYFNKDKIKELSVDLGVRIHGRGTRFRSQKSLRFYARDKYGSDSISYPFFTSKNIRDFKRLILRTPDADESRTLFKDELIHTLIKDMELDAQAFLPAVVFLNGEYWGIHNIRERQDKYYIWNNHRADPENLDMLGLSLDGNEELEGTDSAYNSMLEFIRNNNLSETANYQQILKWIDIDNFIDFHIAQLFLANYDWPRNNVRYWRARTPEAKWRWLFFDCDVCFKRDQYNFLRQYIIEDERFEEGTFLIRNLLKNEEFRRTFNKRFLYHLNTTFETGRINKTIDEFKKLYSPLVQEHIRRWGYPESFNSWLDNIESLRTFAIKRPLEMMDQLMEIFQDPFSIYPNPVYDKLYIESPATDSLAATISLYNMNGAKFFEHKLGAASNLNTQFVDTRELQPGIYILRIVYGNMIFNKKFVKTELR